MNTKTPPLTKETMAYYDQIIVGLENEIQLLRLELAYRGHPYFVTQLSSYIKEHAISCPYPQQSPS